MDSLFLTATDVEGLLDHVRQVKYGGQAIVSPGFIRCSALPRLLEPAGARYSVLVPGGALDRLMDKYPNL